MLPCRVDPAPAFLLPIVSLRIMLASVKFKLSTAYPEPLMKVIVRAIVYLWALPTTAIGLLLALAAITTGGTARRHTGVLEVHGGFATYFLKHMTLLPGGAAAITLGHVVLGCDPYCLNRTRTHERVHVRQVERWGALFIPAYVIASLVAKLRGGNAYHDNAFEREAYAIDVR
jgi:hypothetical protein